MFLSQAEALALAELKRRELLYAQFEPLIKKVYGSTHNYEMAIQSAGSPNVEPFNKFGIVLQPKQLEFVKWAQRVNESIDTPNEIGYGGARGGGKSFTLFSQASVYDCQLYGGIKGLFLRKTAKRAQEQLRDLVQVVLKRVPHKFTTNRISFHNDSSILIGHYQSEKEAMNYLGIEYDFIIIEEATGLSEQAYKMLRLSARNSSKDYRPRIYNSTNPLGVGHAWYKKRFIAPFNDGTELEHKRKFISATIDDNQFVNREYVDNLEDLIGVEYEAYRWGNWDVPAGAYFSNWNEKINVIPTWDKIPEGIVEVWASMDYGYNHWNVVYLHAKDGDGILYTFDELAHRFRYPDEISADFFTMLSRYELNIDDLRIFKGGGDIFANTGVSKDNIAKQYQQNGILIKRADTKAGSRVAGATELRRLLGSREREIAPRWFITRKCKKLIESLPYLQIDPHHPEDVLKTDTDNRTGTGGDDFYDAARYGIYKPTTSQIS